MSVTDGISLKQYVCFTAQPQCKIGTPLEGVSCGGLGPTGPIGCPDPRYECVGEALAYDGLAYVVLSLTRVCLTLILT